MQREAMSAGNIQTAGIQLLRPACITVAKQAKDTAKAARPCSITGFRPQRSLRTPQNADEKIQITALAAKIVVMLVGLSPSWRPSGGRMV